MTPARVVFFGYHSIGARCLAGLLSRGARVSAVVTHAGAPGEARWFESVADLARGHGLPVHVPPSPNTPEMLERLQALGPELLLSVYYRRLLAPELLALPTIAAVNLHGSLLPRYRGRAPLNWAIIHGERETGVTLHHMTTEADAGDVIAQSRVVIGPDDTALVVYQRMIVAADALLAETLPGIVAGTAARIPQDPTVATVFGRRRPEDGRFEWSWPGSRIHNLVRAVTHPYPGAFTAWKGRRLFVWQSRLVEANPDAMPPGLVLETRDQGFVVQTGRGQLLVTRLQVDGEAELDGRAFLAEAGIGAGMVLEP